MNLSISWKGHQWDLSPEKAVYWPQHKAWLVADLHLGKTEHFRKAGIPLPKGSCAHTLERLDRLIQSKETQELIVLGDLFHSTYNTVWEEFADWRKRYPSIQVHLVEGNHDILDDAAYQRAELILHEDRWNIDGVELAHDPADASEGFPTIAGHLHPGFKLKGKGRQRLRLPCFWFQDDCCVLPAAGFFTGLSEIRRNKGDRVFVSTKQSVIEV